MRHAPVLDHGGSHGSRQVDPPAAGSQTVGHGKGAAAAATTKLTPLVATNGKVTLGEKKHDFSRDENHQIYSPCEYNMEGGASMTSFFWEGGVGGSHFSPSTFDGKKSDT